jgi:hypothetical protein
MATFLDVAPLIAIAWLIHAAVGLGLAGAIVEKTRAKIRWQWIDFLGAVVPFGAWFALAGFCGVVPKNIPNILFEPLLLALALPAAAAIRVFVRDRLSHAIILVALLVLLSGVGVGIYFAVPTIGE